MRVLAAALRSLLRLNGNPVINIPQELRDDYIYDSFYRANAKAQVVTKVVSTLVEVFLRGVEQSPIWIDIFYGATRLERATAFFKTVGLGLGDKLSPITSKITSLFRKVAVAIVIVLVVAIIVASLIMYLTGPDSKVGKLGTRILFTTIGLITMVIGIGGAASAIMNIGKAVSNAAKGAAIVGAIIAGIITWGVFIYSAIASGAGAFSLAMNSLFADAVAATCTIVLMTALACTGVGAIIVGIIAAIDGLITAICYAAGAYEQEESHWARQYVCIGISGWVTKIFKWILYSATYMVDYDNGARLEFTGLDQSLQDWTKGMVPENPMSYTLGVTNYITLSDIPIDWKAAVFFWQYSHSTAKSSTFVYKMQPAETDIHDGLERGSISDVWQDTGRNHVWSGNFEARTDGFSIAMPAPGINRAPVAYFSEGSAVPVQECLGIPVPPLWYPIPICYIRTERATINSDLSSSLTVDVFPKTLDDFYDLVEVTSGGYSFAWGRDTEPTFPTFKDADGDGLTSPALGGNDPDDSRFDTDNDGLTDYYETMQGLNPRLFDTDDDGLNDGQEVDLSTDPLRKDSDGDGLPDTEELQGWLFTYAFEADGTPRETKVYSDPLMPDTDFDGVTDLQEKIYGFNPNVSQAVNILDYQLSTRELELAVSAANFQRRQRSQQLRRCLALWL